MQANELSREPLIASFIVSDRVTHGEFVWRRKKDASHGERTFLLSRFIFHKVDLHTCSDETSIRKMFNHLVNKFSLESCIIQILVNNSVQPNSCLSFENSIKKLDSTENWLSHSLCINKRWTNNSRSPRFDELIIIIIRMTNILNKKTANFSPN